MRECCRSAKASAAGSGWQCRECGSFGGSTRVVSAPTPTEADNPWWVYSVRRINDGYFPWACVIKVVTHRLTLPVLGEIEITRTVHRMQDETPVEALVCARDWVDRFGAQRLQQTGWGQRS